MYKNWRQAIISYRSIHQDNININPHQPHHRPTTLTRHFFYVGSLIKKLRKGEEKTVSREQLLQDVLLVLSYD
jgi:hypothetical protein